MTTRSKRLGKVDRSIERLAEKVIPFPSGQRFNLENTKKFITNLVRIDQNRDVIYQELEGLLKHPDPNIAVRAEDVLQDFDMFLNQRKELSIRLRALMKLLQVPSP